MSATIENLQVRRRRFLSPTYQTFYEEPVHFVRGEGVWLYDPDGNAYLDAYNNVVSVGHCHPHVVAALAKQAAILNTHTRYLHDLVVDYAERLLATVPSPIGRAIFTCTGSEANDVALRVAEYATGGTGVVVTRWAYHGGTMATTALSPSAGSPLGPHHRTVPAPDTFHDNGKAVADFPGNVSAAMQDMLDHGVKPSALLIDSAFSSDGIYIPDATAMRAAAQAAHRFGALVIADEVQPGLGRLGSGLWGFRHYGIEADIVTLGKPMGDGHPLGGLLLKPELVEGFGSIEGYFNTYGGNPVAAAVGLAVLDVVESEGLIDNSRDTGAYLRQGLAGFRGRHGIADVRGAGLYCGVEFAGDDMAATKAMTKKIVNGMRRHRVLISACGESDTVLKIRPPLSFTKAHADQLIDSLGQVLRETC
jgi:4-aminobutyrate aminotransferase-like enzyme